MMPLDGSMEDTLDESTITRLRLVTSLLTDVGCKRSHNEDAVAQVVDEGSESGMLVVADGMGGHSGGAEASRLVVDALVGGYRAHPASGFADVVRLIQESDLLIAKERPGSGTTVVVALIDGAGATMIHVGDSRAYLFRGDDLVQLTEDQSWVQAQVSAGRITPEQALQHPRRNVLLQAVGTGRQEPPAVRAVRFLPGDVILLCSDGLHGVLSAKEIRDRLKGSQDESGLATMARELVESAKTAGAPDNVTVALAAVHPVGSPSASR